MKKDQFKYDSKEKLILDFIQLFREQYKEREVYIADFAEKNNVNPELITGYWDNNKEDMKFSDAFHRAKPPAQKKYADFMRGIPFCDLVMIERFIGHHDFLVEHDLILYDQDNTYSTSYITKDQRWTVLQYIQTDVLRIADLAKKHLNELKSLYPDSIEDVLSFLIPKEFR